MSVLQVHDRDGYLFFDEEECGKAGQALAARYRTASPFPHIAVDELLDPEFLRGLLGEFPDTRDKTYFDRDQERFKYQIVPAEIEGRRLRNLVMELNSPAFLKFLEEMTGITGLIPDPYYVGGGLHETRSGGHLGVHADFNIHSQMKVERRLNLLIYLNDEWPAEYGGDLELWDTKMTKCEVKVAPIIGRAVVFNTSLDSYHGQPEPLTCPPERSRRSIATYYYTAREEGLASLPDRTTIFKQRPNSSDSFDWRVSLHHFMRDWVPPKIHQLLSRK